ncbi:hypothetical protein [Aquimarina sp. I32.4]|uniref:hypothetical protein n=1 Tax=Aquimarina sp. I32.4 TaxID=2053903 RepID=UPI000CDEC42D|nr:hypothetical protein [Aquimarina sp. I32.4]
MKLLKQKVIIVILIIISFNLNVKAQTQTDSQELYAIVNTFKTAIYDSTKEQDFYNLFLHDSITWASISEGKTKASREVKDDYRPFYTGSFKDFYNYVKKEGDCRERFYNLTIKIENNYATVSFDYTFEKKEKITNWGKEHWTLIKLDNEWKITCVLWTVNSQNIEKCPFTNNSYYKE